jgi:hypothetical protein
MRAPFPLHPSLHLLLFVFLMMAVLTRVRCNLSIVLTCISFMIKVAKQFTYLLAIATSLEKCVFNSFTHLLIGLSVLLLSILLNSLYTLYTNSLSDKQLAKMFS